MRSLEKKGSTFDFGEVVESQEELLATISEPTERRLSEYNERSYQESPWLRLQLSLDLIHGCWSRSPRSIHLLLRCRQAPELDDDFSSL